ncbi:hypothetical protein WDA79_02270 [Streptomyces sp. A475]|uniref:hypothetical protein n=1 Tax=Streptomyces sp. A475 TaxID=3131976 RepID=UPI0030C952B9
MWEITRQLRKVVLALADASWLDAIEAQAQQTRDALGHLLQSEIEARNGHPLHVTASQQAAGPSVYGHPTPDLQTNESDVRGSAAVAEAGSHCHQSVHRVTRAKLVHVFTNLQDLTVPDREKLN